MNGESFSKKNQKSTCLQFSLQTSACSCQGLSTTSTENVKFVVMQAQDESVTNGMGLINVKANWLVVSEADRWCLTH